MWSGGAQDAMETRGGGGAGGGCEWHILSLSHTSQPQERKRKMAAVPVGNECGTGPTAAGDAQMFVISCEVAEFRQTALQRDADAERQRETPYITANSAHNTRREP